MKHIELEHFLHASEAWGGFVSISWAFLFNAVMCTAYTILYHRLRSSASPVLTATHHSYGSLTWLSDFFPHSPRGQTPQPIFTQNGSNDVFSCKDVPFAVKIATFQTP